MKKDEIRVGETYTAKVSGGVVPVRITAEKWKGDKHTGWVGVNTTTNRSVYIKSAMRLRRRVGGGGGGPGEQPQEPAKAARLPLPAPGGDVGPGGAEGEVVALAQAGSPRPPKGNKAATKAKGAKAPKAAKPAGKKKRVAPAQREPKPRKEGRPLSGLDAAAKVLTEAKEPMRVADIVAAAKAKGYWESKNGKTPEATVYAAIIREIRDKGGEARFVKKDRGLFAAAGR